MKTLDRKALLAIKVELPSETVDVPEWGVSVILRGLTGKEQSALYRSASKKGGGVDEETFAARLVSVCLFDKDGNRLLEDGEYEAVLSWPGPVFNRLVQASMRLNGLADSGN